MPTVAADDSLPVTLDPFVADDSHELRTPLTTITGWAELYPEQGARRGPGVAVVVLLLWLRSSAAAAVPVLAAVVGVATGLGVLDLLGHVVDVPTVAPTLATMIGLGVGVDYALFQVVRTRRLLADGLAVQEAVRRSGGSSGHAAMFAGATVVVALSGLALAGNGFVGALGRACADLRRVRHRNRTGPGRRRTAFAGPARDQRDTFSDWSAAALRAAGPAAVPRPRRQWPATGPPGRARRPAGRG